MRGNWVQEGLKVDSVSGSTPAHASFPQHPASHSEQYTKPHLAAVASQHFEVKQENKTSRRTTLVIGNEDYSLDLTTLATGIY